jgi:pimeloyl-ACP methyl ester carboxylesterase
MHTKHPTGPELLTLSLHKMPTTVLFVPGAWHTAAHLSPFCNLLHAHGYETSCPKLVSCGGPASCKMQDDVDVVKRELERLLEGDVDIVVVGHSYGAVVVTEAALPEYSKTAREIRGRKGGVIHLLYMSGALLRLGMNSSDLRLDEVADLSSFIIDVSPSNTDYACQSLLTIPHQKTESSTCRMDDPKARFYNDLPPEEQAHWESLLTTMPLGPLASPLTHAGYLHYPCTYLLCTKDRSIVPELQRKSIGWAMEAGARMNIVTCDSGE